MAEVNTSSGNGGRRKKGQPARMNLRVDFTPMVDMNMLLITFFMFCTTLTTPQVMDIVMPTKHTEPDGTEVSNLKVTTVLLGKDHKVYYYMGNPDYDNPNALKTTDLSAEGLRNILLEKNSDVVAQMQALKVRKSKKEITDDRFKAEMSELRKAKGGQTVIIKPTDRSVYSDLVNTLDEMQICGISKYAVVDVEEADKYLLSSLLVENAIAQASNTN